MNQCIKSLMKFLDQSPYAYKATLNIVKELKNAGFTALNPSQKDWRLEEGNSYYIQIPDFSAVIAFRLGRNKKDLRLIAAHTDSPSLKLKLASSLKNREILDASIEVYGAPIYATWLDRDLSLGGYVYIKKGNEIDKKEIDFENPIGIIPNLAIHLNRHINEKVNYNPHTHMKVMYALNSQISQSLQQYLEEKLQAPILASHLHFYDTQKASLNGLNKEFISSGRLDNLAMCHSSLQALLNTPSNSSLNMVIFFDNEEIGSQTSGGAMSCLLMNTLNRLYSALGVNSQELLAILSSQAFLISADMSHALHPSYPEKFDLDYAPLLGKGPVIKSHANFKYATTAYTQAYFSLICQEAQIPYQNFLVRADMPCGSTIGTMTNALSSIRTVDIGSPLWAMHSIRETASVQDHMWMTQALSHFFKR